MVDYIGVARHLNEALKDYDGEDTDGSMLDISVELPKLLDRRDRAVPYSQIEGSRICSARSRSAWICWQT